jgi:hypothetical protein
MPTWLGVHLTSACVQDRANAVRQSSNIILLHQFQVITRIFARIYCCPARCAFILSDGVPLN